MSRIELSRSNESCRSISASRPLAPIRNSVLFTHSLPNSSFIKLSQSSEALALRMPPAGLKPGGCHSNCCRMFSPQHYTCVRLWKCLLEAISDGIYLNCFASASSTGVGVFAPRNPMRSARVPPSVIRIMFGLGADIEDAGTKNTSRLPKTKASRGTRAPIAESAILIRVQPV